LGKNEWFKRRNTVDGKDVLQIQSHVQRQPYEITSVSGSTQMSVFSLRAHLSFHMKQLRIFTW